MKTSCHGHYESLIRRRSLALSAVLIGAAGIAALTFSVWSSAGRREAGSPVPGVAAVIDATAPSSDLFNAQFCGAVLVAPDIALTAAHCVSDREADRIHVVVGADNLCRTHPISGTRTEVQRIDVHPLYDADAGGHDLALLTLSRSFPHDVRRVAPDQPPSGTATVLGWGRASSSGVPACRLMRVDLELLQADACTVSVPPDGSRRFDPETMLCAVPKDDGADSCVGDSGGPLIDGDINHGAILGIVSWGRGCSAGIPGVYARADLFGGAGGWRE